MAMFKDDFAKEDPWRVFKIMSEFVDGFELLTHVKKGVSIFGSSQAKRSGKYYKLACETGYALAKKGYSIITGAGSGIMEAANKGAKEAKGESIGLNILIPVRQKPNKYLTEVMEFKYFFCRKVMFAKYSKALVVFPGGFGTLDEFSEFITLIQTGRITPIPVILIGKEYWEGLVDWMENIPLKRGAIKKKDLAIFQYADTPKEVVKILSGFGGSGKNKNAR